MNPVWATILWSGLTDCPSMFHVRTGPSKVNLESRKAGAGTLFLPAFLLSRCETSLSPQRLNQRVEPVEIHRLDQVMLETRGVTLLHVAFHPVAGQRNSRDAP